MPDLFQLLIKKPVLELGRQERNIGLTTSMSEMMRESGTGNSHSDFEQEYFSVNCSELDIYKETFAIESLTDDQG
jgi:hypothetical protein